MRLQHAGRDHGAGAFLPRQGAAQNRFDGLARHASGAQQARSIGQAGDDGGFDADLRGAPIQDDVHAPGQVFGHMVGAGRAHPARAIGGGGRHRLAEGFQKGQRNGVGRNAQADAVQPRAGQRAHRTGGSDGRDQRQRPRPEGQRQCARLRVENPLALRRRKVSHMGDQRVEGGATLGRIDARHRLAAGGVRPQPIDGLGGEGDETASGERARGLAQASGGAQMAGVDVRRQLHCGAAAFVYELGDPGSDFALVLHSRKRGAGRRPFWRQP